MVKSWRVPSIKTINELAGTNGLSVISTFAGAGGSSTGYKWAGYDMRVAAEFMPEAIASYKANAPSTHILTGDIRDLSGWHFMNLAGLNPGELDVFDGSPPCKSFSMNGKREAAWGKEVHYSKGTSQRSDDLFGEYLRLVAEMRPKVCVAENVPGMVQGAAAGYFKEVCVTLAGLGYRVEARRLNARQLEIPQQRQRLIFVAVREDLDRAPAFPRPFGRQITVGEAIADLPKEPLRELYQMYGADTRTYMAWWHSDVLKEKGCFSAAYKKLGWSGPDEKSRFNWIRVPPNAPCPAVTAQTPTLFHWDQPRTFSIPEIKRVCSFPDDFALSGNFRDQWERLGRAVPPKLMFHVADTIAREVFDK